MRAVLTMAVLLTVVSMALVAVCQHSETRRLQYRIWQLERRRDRLERMGQRLTLALEATRTPRRLLCERDGYPQGLPPGTAEHSAGSADLTDVSAPGGPPWLFDAAPGSGR